MKKLAIMLILSVMQANANMICDSSMEYVKKICQDVYICSAEKCIVKNTDLQEAYKLYLQRMVKKELEDSVQKEGAKMMLNLPLPTVGEIKKVIFKDVPGDSYTGNDICHVKMERTKDMLILKYDLCYDVQDVEFISTIFKQSGNDVEIMYRSY
ncbi:hypothetical protein DCO58_03425 [Helicobacter saguini]|uniref:DUF1311 domain-containing protein n=1 Tax=Helicobacter saguini TaxID=1548018 RepID=A0A099BD23_9HELI|nr:hypothetical protein [Helicobacter saguini]MWV62577.1 hypothetical protein [Helicobacter saguini]MWV66749.1 hypothetical protein [Helicobacter saguini]MWV69100.1 hypothetical protein [Helicobacter saguini]MWV71345.1 hypothetical protein [Helicobacter saguini]TLD91535.1 hypothetical protein LS64_011810 [Helicobacter saguini]